MKVKIKDKDFDIFLTDKEIEASVSALAKRINADYSQKDPSGIPILTLKSHLPSWPHIVGQKVLEKSMNSLD